MLSVDDERDRRVEAARAALRNAGLRAHVSSAFGNPQRQQVEVRYPGDLDALSVVIRADEVNGEWCYRQPGRAPICTASDVPALVAWVTALVNPPYGATAGKVTPPCPQP